LAVVSLWLSCLFGCRGWCLPIAECCYGVATIGRLLNIVGRFCRIWSLVQRSFVYWAVVIGVYSAVVGCRVYSVVCHRWCLFGCHLWVCTRHECASTTTVLCVSNNHTYIHIHMHGLSCLFGCRRGCLLGCHRWCLVGVSSRWWHVGVYSAMGWLRLVGSFKF